MQMLTALSPRSDLQTVVSATEGELLSPAVIVVGETAGAPLFTGMGEDGDVGLGSKGGEGQGKGQGGGDGNDGGGGLLIDRFETFLLDMDGVLWEGGHVLPGAVEAGTKCPRAMTQWYKKCIHLWSRQL